MIKRIPNKAVFLFFIGLALLLLASCSKKDDTPTEPKSAVSKSAPIPVSFATSKNVWCALGLLAKSKGFFAEEGLDVNINIQSAGRYCMDALLSKSAQFGTVVEVNVAYVGFTGSKDVTVVASVVESVSFAVVADKRRGILVPQDLKGKSLAFSPGTGGELFAYRFLDHNKIKREDVEIRKIQPLGIQEALSSAGGVAAAATWEPFYLNCLKALGTNGIAFRDPEAYRGYMFLGAQTGWAKQNPAIVQSFIRALIKAERYLTEHSSEAQDVLGQQINFDKETLLALWGDFKFTVAMDKARLLRDTTGVAKTIMETQPDFASKTLPVYDDYFDSSFLEHAVKAPAAKSLFKN